MPYLVLHKIEVKDGVSKVSPLTYPVNKPIDKEIDEYGTRIAYDPQFSPDGRYVLFKFGESMSFNGGYRLYVLDTATNSTKLVSEKYLSYAFVSWSPDSNYIAFVEGGDAEGGIFALSSYIGPLSLFVCNWRTGKEYMVTGNDTIRGPFFWRKPHTLLYGVLSEKGQKELMEHEDASSANENGQKDKGGKAQLGAIKTVKLEPRPDVYEYSIEKRSSKLLFHDGYRPVASPDGKRIAFFGSEHPEKPFPLRDGWQDHPEGASLSVAQADGTKRIAIDQEGDNYPFVCWLPDNQHLLTVEQTQDTPNAQAEVNIWDINTRRFQRVALLKAKDYKALPRSIIEPQFLGLGLHGSDTLYVFVTECTGADPKSGYLMDKGSLQIIDLGTGKITTVAETTSDSGVDWYDDSVPVSISTSTAKPQANVLPPPG